MKVYKIMNRAGEFWCGQGRPYFTKRGKVYVSKGLFQAIKSISRWGSRAKGCRIVEYELKEISSQTLEEYLDSKAN